VEGDWLYEINYDGYRALASKDSKDVPLKLTPIQFGSPAGLNLRLRSEAATKSQGRRPK
jgi:hypothetical protein